jgi:hypothetical protein
VSVLHSSDRRMTITDSDGDRVEVVLWTGLSMMLRFESSDGMSRGEVLLSGDDINQLLEKMRSVFET